MKIDVRTKDCLYVELNGWTYYIDDSTNEQIIEKWKVKEEPYTNIDNIVNDMLSVGGKK